MKSLIYIITILLMSAICSCRSIQYVPIESKTTVKDSLNIRDSLVAKEITNIKDSVITRDSVVVVLDDKGNVLRTELYRQKEIYRDLQKDYYELQSKYNSLLSQKTDSIPVPYPVEKQLTRWQSFKMSVGGYAVVILSLGLIGLIIYVIRKIATR